jgi:hypothetical protein
MAKPANMKQSTWEYLLKFTSNHEGVVLTSDIERHDVAPAQPSATK